MITRSGWVLAIGSILTIVAGRVLGLAELYILGATGLALVVAAAIRVRRPPPELAVERTIHPPRVPLGGQSRVELRIRNRSRRRAPVLTLLDPVAGTIGAQVSLAPLAPGDQQAASYRLPTERRGLVHIGPMEARVSDPFGLARRRHVVAGKAVLTVLPAIDPLLGAGTGGGLDDPLAGIAHPMLGSRGDEDFSSLRPYVVGDDLRRVHWASSARIGDLLVRQDDPPWRGHLTVLLDAREDRLDPERFELAVSAAASLLHAVSLRGDRARLVMTDGTDTGLLDARASADRLLEHLALVVRHPTTELPEVGPGGRSRTGGLVFVTGDLEAADLGHLQGARDRFATVRVVAIDASAVGSPRRPGPAPQPGGNADAPPTAGTTTGGRGRIEILRVDGDTSFPAAWSAARPIGARR